MLKFIYILSIFILVSCSNEKDKRSFKAIKATKTVHHNDPDKIYISGRKPTSSINLCMNYDYIISTEHRAIERVHTTTSPKFFIVQKIGKELKIRTTREAPIELAIFIRGLGQVYLEISGELCDKSTATPNQIVIK